MRFAVELVLFIIVFPVAGTALVMTVVYWGTR